MTMLTPAQREAKRRSENPDVAFKDGLRKVLKRLEQGARVQWRTYAKYSGSLSLDDINAARARGGHPPVDGEWLPREMPSFDPSKKVKVSPPKPLAVAKSSANEKTATRKRGVQPVKHRGAVTADDIRKALTELRQRDQFKDETYLAYMRTINALSSRGWKDFGKKLIEMSPDALWDLAIDIADSRARSGSANITVRRQLFGSFKNMIMYTPKLRGVVGEEKLKALRDKNNELIHGDDGVRVFRMEQAATVPLKLSWEGFRNARSAIRDKTTTDYIIAGFYSGYLRKRVPTLDKPLETVFRNDLKNMQVFKGIGKAPTSGNYYNVKTGEVVLRDYKSTSAVKWGDVLFETAKPLLDAIRANLKKRPKAKWLIATRDESKPVAASAIASRISKIFNGAGVNDARKAVATYYALLLSKENPAQSQKIVELHSDTMLHSLKTHMSYIHAAVPSFGEKEGTARATRTTLDSGDEAFDKSDSEDEVVSRPRGRGASGGRGRGAGGRGAAGGRGRGRGRGRPRKSQR